MDISTANIYHKQDISEQAFNLPRCVVELKKEIKETVKKLDSHEERYRTEYIQEELAKSKFNEISNSSANCEQTTEWRQYFNENRKIIFITKLLNDHTIRRIDYYNEMMERDRKAIRILENLIVELGVSKEFLRNNWKHYLAILNRTDIFFREDLNIGSNMDQNIKYRTESELIAMRLNEIWYIVNCDGEQINLTQWALPDLLEIFKLNYTVSASCIRNLCRKLNEGVENLRQFEYQKYIARAARDVPIVSAPKLNGENSNDHLNRQENVNIGESDTHAGTNSNLEQQTDDTDTIKVVIKNTQVNCMSDLLRDTNTEVNVLLDKDLNLMKMEIETKIIYEPEMKVESAPTKRVVMKELKNQSCGDNIKKGDTQGIVVDEKCSNENINAARNGWKMSYEIDSAREKVHKAWWNSRIPITKFSMENLTNDTTKKTGYRKKLANIKETIIKESENSDQNNLKSYNSTKSKRSYTKPKRMWNTNNQTYNRISHSYRN